MARLNIEDSLFRDLRFLDLVAKTGCRFKAMGLVISAWMLAQDNWLKYQSIPKKAWLNSLDPLIEVELALKNEDGSVYIKGSENAFGWLEQKSKAGKVKSDEKLTQLENARKKKAKTVERELNGTERKLNGSEALSLSPSLSPSLSLTQSQSLPQTLDLNTPPSGESGNAAASPSETRKLIQLWNENCGKLAKVVKSSPQRDRKMKALWNQIDEAQWIEVISKLSKSDFCLGKNDRGWKADFDFLLKPDTWSKALEGRYDNRATTQNGMTEDGRYLTPAMKRSHNNMIMMKKLFNKEENTNEINEQHEERDVNFSSSNG